ncbi:MAG: tetratricopeptide repeat protein [Phycisphaerales bacterium]
MPDLRDAEAPVIEKITRAREQVVKDLDSAGAWGRLGIMLDAHGLYEDALPCYLRAGQLDPTNYRWPYLTAIVLADDDPVQAITHFERAIEVKPQSSAIRHTFADTLLRAGRLEETEAQYREALKLDPENRNALLGLGELAMRENRLEEALRRLSQALGIEPYDSEVHEKLARLYTRLGDPAKAEQEAMLVKAFPEKAPVRDPVRAEVAAEAVSSTSVIRRGLAHARHGRERDAEAAFRQVLQSHPEHIKALLNLGAVLVKQGRTAEAVDQLRAALTLAEDNAEVHSNLGVALAYDKQVPQALEHIRTALRLDPNNNEAYYNLGWILEGQGKTDQARAAYQRALELNPVNVRAHNNLGKILASRGQLEEAVRHWQHAVAYSRGNPEALFNLAVAFIQQERFGEAVALLERGLQQDSQNLRMMAGLATLLATCPEARHRDGDRAVELAQGLVQRSGGNHIPSLNLLAAAQAEARDFDRAIRTSQQALALATSSKQRLLIRLTRSRLQLYQVGLPYHQPPKDSGSEDRQAAPDG